MRAIIFALCVGYSAGLSIITRHDAVELPSKIRHPCNRPCTVQTSPMVCDFTFKVEWYKTMSRACYNCPGNVTDCYREHCIPGDGISRPILVVNRQMPGPSIEVCHGDEIVVNVQNHLANEETAIHWHGQHQRKTPYMDGVPYVTQCPIPSGSSFTYRFRATQIGTHFWHSHSGLQRGDGCHGPLIIKPPQEKDPNFDLYDYDLSEHVITVVDWIHETSLTKYINHHHDIGDNKPETLLINGLGYLDRTNSTKNVPAPKFKVQQGFRYRFRVINAEFLNCPVEISVDNHTMTVISSDGNDFEPIEVDSFVTYAGERFDFVLAADQEVGNYWMRFRGLMDCDERFLSAHQVAVLQYGGAELDAYPPGETDYASSHRGGLQLNALNEGTTNYSSISIPKLNATLPIDESLKTKPDYQFYISYDFYNLSNPKFYTEGLYDFFSGQTKHRRHTPQLNHISMKLQSFPLLPGRDLIDPDMFCNESSVGNCEEYYCECTHALQVRLGAVVELILVDTGNTYDANHPFHLHGNYFRVVAMERLGRTTTVDEVKALDIAGKIPRKLRGAPLKDTVTVPDGGFTILRFHATNPGYWLFHCHIDYHAELGMAIVFKVGEHSDLPPVPLGFPTCGDWAELPTYDPSGCNTTVAVANTPFYKKFWYQVFPEEDCASKGEMLRLRLGTLLLVAIVLVVT